MQQSSDTIPQLVDRAARRLGSRCAIEDGPQRLSFEALWEACLQAARAFCAAGVETGDRVAIWAPNRPEWIIAAVGLQSAGGILVPLNTRLKGAEAGHILRKSRARMLCSAGQFLGVDYPAQLRQALDGRDARSTVAGLPDLERIVVFPSEGEAAEPRSDDLRWSDFLARGESIPQAVALRRAESVSADAVSDILFTSGTTGQPKGVMTSHGQNLRCFRSWSEIVGLCEGDRYLIVNPFFHSFGYKAGWLSAILCGATILPHAVFDARALLERIARDRVSVLPGPPTLYHSILADPERERFNLSSLRLAVTGAAAIPVELIRRMREELGFDTVITGYGLTESSGVVSMCRPDDDPETIAITSGRAIPDVEVRCVDSRGVQVARGRPGEVVVRGYNVMQGYFEDVAETAAAIDAEGWLHTGDVGVMDERGYLRITDRIKDMFISGGFNCYPAEIENVLHSHPGVAQVAVIGVPDKRMGEVGLAFIVADPRAELGSESILAWCRQRMASYKVPRAVEFVDALPMNATGKVTKFVLRERARSR